MLTDPRLELRRITILQATLELLVEKGYHETHVSHIVERAGVAQGTFYLYFTGKRDAFDTLMVSWFAEFQRVLADASELRPRTFEEAVGRAQSDIATVLRLCAERPLLTRLMLKQAEGVGPDVSERMEEFRQGIAAQIESSLALRQEAGLMRPFNNRVIAQAMVGMIERVAFRWFVMGEEPAISVDELSQELTQFQVWGIAPGAEPRPNTLTRT